jgi:hypothetical protein
MSLSNESTCNYKLLDQKSNSSDDEWILTSPETQIRTSQSQTNSVSKTTNENSGDFKISLGIETPVSLKNNIAQDIVNLLRIHQKHGKSFDVGSFLKSIKNLPEIWNIMKKYYQDLVLEYYNEFYNTLLEREKVNKNDLLVNFFDFNQELKTDYVNNWSEFKLKFDKLTHGLIPNNFNWQGVKPCGGLILESLSKKQLSPNTDIDLFLYGTEEEQLIKVRQLFEFYNKLGLEKTTRELYCDKTTTKVYFGKYRSAYFVCFEGIPITIQIIKTSYTNEFEIINGFDADYCSVLLNNQQGVLCTLPFIKALQTKKTQKNITFNILPKRVYKSQRKGFEILGLNDEEKENYKQFMEIKQYIVENERYFYPTALLSVERNIMFLSTVNRTPQPFSLDYQEILNQDESNDNYDGMDDNYRQMLEKSGLKSIHLTTLLNEVKSALKIFNFAVTIPTTSRFYISNQLPSKNTPTTTGITRISIYDDESSLKHLKNCKTLIPYIQEYLKLHKIKTDDAECKNMINCLHNKMTKKLYISIHTNLNEKITKIYYQGKLITMDKFKEMCNEKIPNPDVKPIPVETIKGISTTKDTKDTKDSKSQPPQMMNKYKISLTNYIDSVNISRYSVSLARYCNKIIVSDR